MIRSYANDPETKMRIGFPLKIRSDDVGGGPGFTLPSPHPLPTRLRGPGQLGLAAPNAQAQIISCKGLGMGVWGKG